MVETESPTRMRVGSEIFCVASSPPGWNLVDGKSVDIAVRRWRGIDWRVMCVPPRGFAGLQVRERCI